jgi:hypothetical protein
MPVFLCRVETYVREQVADKAQNRGEAAGSLSDSWPYVGWVYLNSRSLIVELIHLCLNLIFDMSVIFRLIMGGDTVFIDSDVLLVIDFVNLKIKSVQSFKCAHRDRTCVFIRVIAHTYISMCICTIFLKK